MSAPVRIQLSRAKGWRMPPKTVKVDRSTKWGNPFVIHPDKGPDGKHFPADPKMAVHMFREMLKHDGSWSPIPAPLWPKGKFPAEWTSVDDVRRELAGKNLACWCALDQPCHADVLLEIANGRAP